MNVQLLEMAKYAHMFKKHATITGHVVKENLTQESVHNVILSEENR